MNGKINLGNILPLNHLPKPNISDIIPSIGFTLNILEITKEILPSIYGEGRKHGHKS